MSYLVFIKGKKMKISKKYFQTDTIYKSIGTNPRERQLGCGFVHTVSRADTRQKANFSHYGGFLVLSGTGTYIDEQGEEYTLSPGCFVQRIPDMPHTTIVHGAQEWLEFFVVFGADTYRTLENMGLVDVRPVLYPGVDEMLFGKCKYLLNVFKKSQNSENTMLYTEVLEFVLSVYHYENQKRIGKIKNELYEKMEQAEQLLCSNIQNHMSGREVAEELGIGYENFRKRFKRLYHQSPNAYQMNYRINYAKTMLSDEKYRIEEIALLCGFSDGFAFSKAFKKRCGISPEQFRRNI